MQHAGWPLIQALDVRPSQMGESETTARERHRDLPGVEMAREHEIEHAGLQPADDLYLTPANLHGFRLVGEQAGRTELIEGDRTRKRILRDRVVVIPEYRVRIGQSPDQLVELRLAAWPSEQIARDQRQVRLPRLHPTNRPLDGACPAGRQPQMKVREVRDPQPVELLGKPLDPGRLHLEPDPAGLEPPPRRRAGSGAGQAEQRRGNQGLRFELLEHWRHRDDVTLELELRRLQPRGDPDQLREVEDRHLELAAGRRFQLLLPRVEREVAQRARRHHGVGPRLHRLLDRLDQLAQCRLLTRLDDREPAALDLRGIVDGLAAACLDDRLQRPRPVGALEAEELGRPEDLAAVERRNLEPLQTLVRGLLEPFVALTLRDQPEEVLDLDAAGVRRNADRLEVRVDPLAQLVVLLEGHVGLPQVQRADVADRHQRIRPGRFPVGQDARVQVEVVVRLRLVDVARAAAGDRVELLELQPDARGQRLRRRVELLCRQRSEAALVVRDLHASPPFPAVGRLPGVMSACARLPQPSPLPSGCSWSIFASARSDWTMPSAPRRPSLRTMSYRPRASWIRSATWGGNGSGTFPCRNSLSANFVSLIAETTPCVFGTSSVSRNQPVVFAEMTNHRACFAPMSWSMPSFIDSAPSFAIASRGSTPFGQRSLQK